MSGRSRARARSAAKEKERSFASAARLRPLRPAGISAHPPLLRLLLACGFARAPLLDALERSKATGVDFETALYATTPIREEEVVAALAGRLGLAVAEDTAPGAVRADLAAVARTGLLRLADGRIAIVPRGALLDRLLGADVLAAARGRIVLATRQAALDFALKADRTNVRRLAAQHLRAMTPAHAAAGGAWPWQKAAGLAVVFAFAFLAVFEPGGLALAAGGLAAFFFLALGWLRLGAAGLAPPPAPLPRRMPDRDLPFYTLLVPLHREETALPGLMAALAALDYPAEKIEILLLVEEDDPVTRTALSRLALPGNAVVIAAPEGAPRTKPRALNVGLAMARGDFLVVYDAEDRPAPDQLRAALAAFARGGARTGVVQARLVIDPAQRGMIAAQFRMEYAGLFGVMLPALTALGMPIPLGGTSNHFRTGVLRAIGGWDAHNVTEDADIGIRLHRFGYQARTILSETEEEAPTRPMAWLRQRTRWLKGWMTTLLVHTRQPRRLVRELGGKGTACFVMLTTGAIGCALLEPFALAFILLRIADGSLWANAASIGEAVLRAAFLASFVVGHAAGVWIGLVGLHRAGERATLPLVLFMPVYWLAISLAAWRALGQMLVEPPGRWEKTEHVLERLPRRPALPGRFGQGPRPSE